MGEQCRLFSQSLCRAWKVSTGSRYAHDRERNEDDDHHHGDEHHDGDGERNSESDDGSALHSPYGSTGSGSPRGLRRDLRK